MCRTCGDHFGGLWLSIHLRQEWIQNVLQELPVAPQRALLASILDIRINQSVVSNLDNVLMHLIEDLGVIDHVTNHPAPRLVFGGRQHTPGCSQTDIFAGYRLQQQVDEHVTDGERP